MGGLERWVEPSAGSTAAFLAVIALVSTALLYGASRAFPRRRLAVGAALFAWLALTAAPSATGLVREVDGPAPLIGFFAVSNLTALALGLSPVGRRLAGLPAVALVGFHAFRLPLELVLHTWWTEGVVPVQMTFHGHNLDILTGDSALILAGLALWPPLPWAVLWGFNLLGTGLLLAVMVIATTSSPVPLRLYGDPPLLLGYFFPYAWIVPLCVAPALLGHVVLFRSLLAGREPGSQTS